MTGGLICTIYVQGTFACYCADWKLEGFEWLRSGIFTQNAVCLQLSSWFKLSSS